VRLWPRDGQPRRRLPRAEGMHEGEEVPGGAEEGREVFGEDAGGGEGVEERFEDEVEEGGAEGAALPHAASRSDRHARLGCEGS
jgi:hypothetical protein